MRNVHRLIPSLNLSRAIATATTTARIAKYAMQLVIVYQTQRVNALKFRLITLNSLEMLTRSPVLTAQDQTNAGICTPTPPQRWDLSGLTRKALLPCHILRLAPSTLRAVTAR